MVQFQKRFSLHTSQKNVEIYEQYGRHLPINSNGAELNVLKQLMIFILNETWHASPAPTPDRLKSGAKTIIETRMVGSFSDPEKPALLKYNIF